MFNSGYLYLIIVYIVWGTTYLAMRIGVTGGSGFPVFAFGAARCLIAAVLLLLLAKLRSQAVRVNRKELAQLAFTGLGMWVASHGMVLVAEQYIASGFAAVAVATSPIWVLIIGLLQARHRPGLWNWLFVGIGFLGVAALMVPALRTPTLHNTLSVILLIVSPIIWAYCALFVRHHPMRLSTFTASGYQHLFGGLGFLLLSLLFREPFPAPTAAAWGALAFLVVFGSLIAFTAYLKALSILPVHLVTTNTYVNPVIAVFLGWLVLGEPITSWTLLAMALVLLSVAGIIALEKRQPAPTLTAVPATKA